MKRKRYAAALCGLSVAALVNMPAYAADADTADTQETYQLDPVTVTASGYEERVKDAPASIKVITKEEIAKRGYIDFRDILKDVEGVDVRGTTGRMGVANVSIRGMSSDYTLIMVDGIPQNGAGSSDIGPNGFYSELSSFIPPVSSIERIEVVRGPMSTLYGSDALGGAINIITKKIGDKTHTSLTVDHTFYSDSSRGGVQRYSFDTNGPIAKDKLGIDLRGSYIKRNATADGSVRGADVTRSEMKNYSFGGRLNWQNDPNNLYWFDADFARVDYSMPSGAQSFGYRFDRNKFIFGSENQTDYGKWTSSLSYNTTEMRGFQMTDGTGERELRDNNLIFDTKLVSQLGRNHKVTVGGRYWDEGVDDGMMEKYGVGKATAHTESLFAEDSWKLADKLTFTYGARYDHPSNFDGHVTPRGYLVYKADDKWTVKGGVSTGYKVPTLAQSTPGVTGYSSSWYSASGKPILTYGNPDLKPEESVNREIGAYYSDKSGLSANVTLFDTTYKNKIDSEDIDAYSKTYINTDRGKARGIEFGSKIPLATKLDMKLNYTFTTSRVVGGSDDGAPLTSTPKHAVNAKLDWQASDRTDVWLGAEYRRGIARYSGSALSASQQAVTAALGKYYKQYTVLDLGVSHKLSKSTTMNFTINNLLNKDFSTVSYVNGTAYNNYYSTGGTTTGTYLPGRSYWLSFNYNF